MITQGIKRLVVEVHDTRYLGIQVLESYLYVKRQIHIHAVNIIQVRDWLGQFDQEDVICGGFSDSEVTILVMRGLK